jgi:hypothetical protein
MNMGDRGVSKKQRPAGAQDSVNAKQNLSPRRQERLQTGPLPVATWATTQALKYLSPPFLILLDK